MYFVSTSAEKAVSCSKSHEKSEVWLRGKPATSLVASYLLFCRAMPENKSTLYRLLSDEKYTVLLLYYKGASNTLVHIISMLGNEKGMFTTVLTTAFQQQRAPDGNWSHEKIVQPWPSSWVLPLAAAVYGWVRSWWRTKGIFHDRPARCWLLYRFGSPPWICSSTCPLFVLAPHTLFILQALFSRSWYRHYSDKRRLCIVL